MPTAAPAGGTSFAAAPPKYESLPATRSIEMTSLIAISPEPPRRFKVHDLISILVRQQKKYESEADMESKKKWNIDGKLSEWFRFYPRNRLGTDQLSNGDPGFKFDFNNRYKASGDNEREDKFTTRIQAEIIDVKPNGNLVLEARQHEEHGEEVVEMTLTGVCRSEDVTADNSILSTQVARLVIKERNSGAVTDATTRGWVPRILDFAKPF